MVLSIFNRIKNIKIKVCLIILLCSLITSHYSEVLLTPPLKALRNFVLFGTFEKYTDDNNSLLTNYSFLDKPVYNPVHIAQQAFIDSETYLLNKHYPTLVNIAYAPTRNVDKEKILEIANWILAYYKPEVIENTELIRLPYTFDYPSYDLKAPWYSGMAQGLASVVMIAAYDISNDKKYLLAAEKIGNTLTVPIVKGGTLIHLNVGGIWHEEYADQTKTRHPMVLNGNNYAVDGIFWLNEYSDKVIWAGLLEKSLIGLNQSLYNYVSVAWSRYGLMGNLANWGYHDLHIKQLEKISNLYFTKFPSLDRQSVNSILSLFKTRQYIPIGFVERLFKQRNNLLFGIFLINIVINILIWVLLGRLFKSLR